MPLRLNTGGVIPVIFASSVLAFPLTFMQWLGVQDKPWLANLYHQLDYTMPLHNLLYLLAIISSAYFYISIFSSDGCGGQHEEIRRLHSSIPPGRRTAGPDQILTRLTFVGAIYLGLIALLPQVLISGLHVQALPFIGPTLDAWRRGS